jgi:hypothetical protein
MSYQDYLAERVRNAEHVDARWEDAYGRCVRCPLDDQCPRGLPDVLYARAKGGGHGHYEEYESPHRRLVIRLPHEPGDARDGAR